jgi:hypothetical protein
MATSLSTEFLSGGFSIQRNEMVSMLQQKHQQKFQFLNSFNQTFTRLEQPAQGEFDRLAPYALSSQKRSFLGGSVTTVTQPLTQIFRKGTQKCSLGISNGSINANGGITAIDVLSGGFGYAPNLEFNVIVTGGEPTAGNLTQCIATATSDGDGRIVSVDIKSTGNNYLGTSANADGTTGPSAIVDEGMAIGQFSVGFFSQENVKTNSGSITGVEAVQGTGSAKVKGHRPGVYYVETGYADGYPVDPTALPASPSDGDTETIGGVVYTYSAAVGEWNSNSGKDGIFQIYVDPLGNVNKVIPIGFGKNYVVGDVITILASQLHNVGSDAAARGTGLEQLQLEITSVTDAAQIALDYGTVSWRSETFEVGEQIVLEYYLDTKRARNSNDGLLRTLARDMTLHPYGNYYSSAFSAQTQRTATLTFAGAVVIGSGLTQTFTLTDENGKTLVDDQTAADGDATLAMGGLKSTDVGKRIVEPHGQGVVKIQSIDAATGVVTVLCDNAVGTTSEVNGFDLRIPASLVYAPGEWKLCIAEADFESQPYNMIYPYINEDAVIPIATPSNGQQLHREVKSCVDRIGDLFVVESEKATDLLSSKNDINSATSAIPSSVSLTQPVKDVRKPQKWRMRFFYDQRDEYLYVNVATALQIKDNGDLTKGQGRDGVKQSVYRQPGELSEIYFNFSNDTNKAKSGFFRRQGKTSDDIESGYPLAYRLSCSDHGTGLFMFDQASVDQDDDYAWFVVQRHVHNVSGRIEFEDGKSPVHCLYSPSTRPEETSDFNVGFYASVSEDLNTTTGETTITSTSLDELQIFDVNGRKLTQGLPVSSSVITDSSPIPAGTTYGSGATYAGPQTSGTNIEMTDETDLGTNSVTGYTIANDFSTFLTIDAQYDNLDAIVTPFSASGIDDRTLFSQSYAGQSGSSYVPISQWVTALTKLNRYASVDGSAPDIGRGSDNGTGGTPALAGGLKNYNAARNQMQGPARLGLTVSRFTHRSADGVDTYLDADDDLNILDKTEEAAQVDANGKARELPIVSNVATFNPQSSNALAIQANRRVRIIHFAEILATYTTDATENAVPVITAGTAGEFATEINTGTGFDTVLVPITNSLRGGSTNGFKIDKSVGGSGGSGHMPGFTPGGNAITEPGSGIFDMVAGDEITIAQLNKSGAQLAGEDSGTVVTVVGMRVTKVVDTFPAGDKFIFEYAWEGAGFNNEYTNFFGRSGTASQPLYEVNRLKIFVDGAEADAAVNGQNYTIDRNGNAQFGTTNQSLEYFGVEKPMYAYSLTTDTFKFNQTIEKGTVVKLSYENYNDVEERDTGKSTYLIKVPEDRDIPNIWNDIHKVAKGIYRFVVRENDVFKPWDYHVSAVIPQVDSPACINPVEQLSITQDKTVIFNFPTPLASQRFIYSDAEMDMICVAGADSSTQGGIIKTSLTKYDLDSGQVSTLEPSHVADTENVSASGDKLNFRQPYSWHNAKQGAPATTASTAFRAGEDAYDTTENSTHRTYVGMMSTKPFGNGMRLFLLTRGGPIRPQYSDYTPRDVEADTINTFGS